MLSVRTVSTRNAVMNPSKGGAGRRATWQTHQYKNCGKVIEAVDATNAQAIGVSYLNTIHIYIYVCSPTAPGSTCLPEEDKSPGPTSNGGELMAGCRQTWLPATTGWRVEHRNRTPTSPPELSRPRHTQLTSSTECTHSGASLHQHLEKPSQHCTHQQHPRTKHWSQHEYR